MFLPETPHNILRFRKRKSEFRNSLKSAMSGAPGFPDHLFYNV
jgi:hypothetical protein